MIINFYKRANGSYHYLGWKNLQIIPRIGEKIVFSHQVFIVKDIEFNIDISECNIYMRRV